MITLITYPGLEGELSLSPFCTKAVYLLMLSGQSWHREDTNDPRKMPKQKLPAIRTADGQIIGDSDQIRLYLEARGADFQPGLTDIQKAVSRSWIRLAEEHLYFHLVLDRWGRDDVWPVIRETYFKEIPRLLRKPIANGLRNTLIKGLRAQGLGRLTSEERLDRVEQDLQAISAVLWEGSFLMGAQVTLADLSVAPMLRGMRTTPVDTPLTLRIRQDPVLSDYIDRVHAAALGQPAGTTPEASNTS